MVVQAKNHGNSRPTHHRIIISNVGWLILKMHSYVGFPTGLCYLTQHTFEAWVQHLLLILVLTPHNSNTQLKWRQLRLWASLPSHFSPSFPFSFSSSPGARQKATSTESTMHRIARNVRMASIAWNILHWFHLSFHFTSHLHVASDTFTGHFLILGVQARRTAAYRRPGIAFFHSWNLPDHVSHRIFFSLLNGFPLFNILWDTWPALCSGPNTIGACKSAILGQAHRFFFLRKWHNSPCIPVVGILLCQSLVIFMQKMWIFCKSWGNICRKCL